MKRNNILNMIIIITALSFIFFNKAGAVENVFFVNNGGYLFSGPSTIVSLDDGLSMAVINRKSKKISKIKHNHVVIERAIENFEPFDLLAYNGQLFVSSKKSGEVKILSQVDLSSIKTINVSKNSTTYMALSSDKSKIYVASPVKSGDTINIIKTQSNTLGSLPIFPSGLNMVNILVTHNGKLFASSQASNTIEVFDENTNKSEGKYILGLIPDDMVVTDSYLYLSSITKNLISIIDLKTFEKVKDIPFNGSPGKMVFDGKQYIYVLNNDREGNVFRLDINTNDFDDKSCFDSGDCFYTGANPEDGVISRDGKVFYVSNYSDESVTYHYISGKLFIEPRTITVKYINPADSQTDDDNAIKLKAGGGSGKYIWSANYGKLSPILGEELSGGNVTGEEVTFTPPSDEDIYYVTVKDHNSSESSANSKIIVVDIRVTPDRITVPDQTPQVFNITGGTPPYEINSLQGGIVKHSPGESDFTFTPPLKDGIYTIEIKDRNGSPFYTHVELASEGVQTLPADPSRAAIIVAGGTPKVFSNALWPSIEFAAEKIYRILTIEKRFNRDQIYLLSPIDLDGDGDGFKDSIIRNSQGYLEEKHIEGAFQWAGQLKLLDQPLLIFMLGHGDKDKFMLNIDFKDNSNETYLEANKLNQYLKEFQKSSGKEVVVIMDSCHSGSFIDDIAGNGRAIITSTGENNKAFYIMQETDLILSAFISYFLDGINSGRNLLESYIHSCDQIKKSYSQEMCLGKYDNKQPHFFQNPQYDDNGGNNYFDLFMDKKSDDGSMLKSIYIRKPPETSPKSVYRSLVTQQNTFAGVEADVQSEFSNASDTTLSIVSMNSQASNDILEDGEISLKAKVGFAKGSVKSVYGILKPPGMQITDENGISNLSYPQVKLSKNDEVQNLESSNSQIWETKWKDAVYNGCYDINFYVQSANGSVAFSDSDSFTVYSPLKIPDKPSIDIIFNDNQKFGQTHQPLGSSVSKYSTLGKTEDSHKYSNGDTLSISFIEHLNWGYDLYAAIVIPDGTLLSFSGLNQITAFTGVEDSVVKWQGERYQEEKFYILNLKISSTIPKGEYQVHAIMAPQGKSIFDTSKYWIHSKSSFIVQ